VWLTLERQRIQHREVCFSEIKHMHKVAHTSAIDRVVVITKDQR
jgi:hypothetical protein